MELIIIRHGEPDYSHLTYQDNCILPTEAGLTEKGKLQAKEASFNDLLYGAELIICSPFERALETATIINKELKLPLIIEKDLHEWVPDMTYKSKIKELKSLYYDYKQKEGRKVSGDEVWESDEEVLNRFSRCLLKYQQYDKIIIVAHSRLFKIMFRIKDFDYCEVKKIYYSIKK